MAKRFEFFEGRPDKVLRQLEGRKELQPGSFLFYEDKSGLQCAFIGAVQDEGYYPFPPHYEVREYTLDEYRATHDGSIPYDPLLQAISAPYFAMTKNGVRAYLAFIVYDGPKTLVHPTVTINGSIDGTLSITGLDNFKADDQIRVQFWTGIEDFIVDGTKADFATPLDIPSGGYMLGGGISGPDLTVPAPALQFIYREAYSQDISSYPYTMQTGDAVIRPDYAVPGSGGGSNT